MKRIPVNLKDYQHDLLKKWSYEENKSISDIIRRLIDNLKKEKDKEKS
jgi:predicted CopG family antitoxin